MASMYIAKLSGGPAETNNELKISQRRDFT